MLSRDVGCHCDQILVIAVVHIGEARTKLSHILTNQRIGHQVDMVGDDHQIARTERGIDTATCIRHEESLDTEQLHHAHGEGHLLHRVALIVVETTLHSHHLLAAQNTKDQATLMTLNRRNGEVGNGRIFDRILHINALGQATKTRTQDNTHLGGEFVNLRANILGSSFNLF